MTALTSPSRRQVSASDPAPAPAQAVPATAPNAPPKYIISGAALTLVASGLLIVAYYLLVILRVGGATDKAGWLRVVVGLRGGASVGGADWDAVSPSGVRLLPHGDELAYATDDWGGPRPP